MTGALSGGGDRKGRIPDRDIAAIRERVSIEDIVGDYVQLRRAGADWILTYGARDAARLLRAGWEE